MAVRVRLHSDPDCYERCTARIGISEAELSVARARRHAVELGERSYESHPDW
jgi:hypothetical protein